MITDNTTYLQPGPEDLIKITITKKKRLKLLNQQKQWSESDAADVLYCHRQWVPAHQDWYVPYEVLNRLMFDRRMPAECAERLQQFMDVLDISIQKKTEER